jgi:phosphoribosyl-ATP pyrophosphohydrolase
MPETLDTLHTLIKTRKGGDVKKSYVAGMLKKGTKKIAQKVGEEAAETVIAAVSEGKKELIGESADLLFHLSVLWVDRGIKPQDVMDELDKRMGISGLDEKAARQAKKKGK